MKKRSGYGNRNTKSHHQSADSKSSVGNTGKEKSELESLEDDSHNQGFSVWLRSSDGVEMMRLFVIANSILIIVTMAWPNMKIVYEIIKDIINGEDE